MWDKFSPAEMSRRWGLARELMRRHDLNGLLIFGNSGVNRHNEANIFWLTNHLDQPNPITPNEQMGLQLGALTVVTDKGAECLHQVPFEPVVVNL